MIEKLDTFMQKVATFFDGFILGSLATACACYYWLSNKEENKRDSFENAVSTVVSGKKMVVVTASRS
jgi:hypothetical protein